MPEAALPALRSDLRYIVHQQAGGVWYAVHDQRSGRFVKLGSREYRLACAMDGRRSAAAVLAAASTVDPSLVATEQDVQQLANWLGKMGLLQIDAQPPPAANHLKLVFNPLYTRIPLIRGQQLERVAGWIAPWVTAPAVIAILILVVVAAVSVLLNWDEFAERSSNLFVADGRLWWLAAWLLLKSAHELGHAVLAVKVGSQIRAAGISLIFFAPVPYVDISDLWSISNRWHRILCSAGGMLVELALAAVAALVALQTEQAWLQYLACAVATMGTVTTLAFNANPLIRFDGYFIVSDLLNRPNLWTEAQQAVKSLATRLFGRRPAQVGPIRPAYVLYGLACYQYRIMMLLTLAVWAILVWQGVGILLVVWCAYATVIGPWMKSRQAASQQLASDSDPAQAPSRLAAIVQRWSWTVAVPLIALALYLPSPLQPSAPGVVVLREPVTVRTEAEGFLDQVLVPRGEWVEAGQLLAILANPDLELQLRLKQNEIERIEEDIRGQRARGELAKLQSGEAQLKSLNSQLEQLRTKVGRLEVRAPAAGKLLSPDLHRQLGKYFPIGEPMCLIADPHAIEVSVSASQDDVERIRAHQGDSVRLRLAGGSRLEGVVEHVEPRGSDRLHEPLLAAIYGGPITVELEKNPENGESLKLLSPRFVVRVRLEGAAESLPPGQMAWLRIPGRSANLWDALGRWLQRKWQQTEQQAQPSSG